VYDDLIYALRIEQRFLPPNPRYPNFLALSGLNRQGTGNLGLTPIGMRSRIKDCQKLQNRFFNIATRNIIDACVAFYYHLGSCLVSALPLPSALA
jgi:hypothetical protein